jgi:DNA-binding IscR family transcriptional regulator
MQSAIMGVLESMTLQDLVDKTKLGQAENYQI